MSSLEELHPDDLPELAEKGRGRIGRLLSNARVVGHLTIAMGRRSIESEVSALASPGPDGRDRRPRARRPRPAALQCAEPSAGRIGAARAETDLAIPGYEALSASQVVRRLDGLGPERARGHLRARGRHPAAPHDPAPDPAAPRPRGRAGPGQLAGLASGRLVEAVRPAEAGDLERCRELVDEAIAATRRPAGRGAAGWPDSAPAGRARCSSDGRATPTARSVVGTFTDAVVGVGGRHRRPRSAPGPVGRIECFYVEPDARAVGVGQAMVDTSSNGSPERGCTDVDAMALPGDRSSKQLLESSGFKARLLILHRSLG